MFHEVHRCCPKRLVDEECSFSSKSGFHLDVQDAEETAVGYGSHFRSTWFTWRQWRAEAWSRPTCRKFLRCRNGENGTVSKQIISEVKQTEQFRPTGYFAFLNWILVCEECIFSRKKYCSRFINGTTVKDPSGELQPNDFIYQEF